MVSVQKWPFLKVLFEPIKGQENVFNDILDLKNAFLSCKNKKLKKSKNGHFSKGVNRWFLSRKELIKNYYWNLCKISGENYYANIGKIYYDNLGKNLGKNY